MQEKSVLVLLSSYNGEKYIEEQIRSILAQKDVKVDILVRDDCSSDGTLDIINRYPKHGALTWYTGKNLGVAHSFMDLVKNAKMNYDFYAFSDQDDVWKDDKLIRAVSTLDKNDISSPQLYCANYKLVDKGLKAIYNNKIHLTTTSFGSSIVFSNCTGCTMVFNNCLLRMLKKCTPKNIIMHDDWVHKVCLAIGGSVYYDNSEVLLYRQHENNVDGGIHSFKNKLVRMHDYVFGKRRFENRKQLIELLKIYKNNMPQKNIYIAEKVIRLSQGNFFNRIKLILSKEYTTPSFGLKKEFVLYNILKCW